MSISATVRYFLDKSGVAYRLVPHSRTYTSMETAEAAHVAGDRLAKAVLVKRGDGPLVVVVPSTHHVRLASLAERFGDTFELATEADAQELFRDCDVGSIPPLAQAYGLPVAVDDVVLAQDEVYFEGGDHEELVRVSGEDFRRLMAPADHGTFGRHAQPG